MMLMDTPSDAKQESIDLKKVNKTNFMWLNVPIEFLLRLDYMIIML